MFHLLFTENIPAAPALPGSTSDIPPAPPPPEGAVPPPPPPPPPGVNSTIKPKIQAQPTKSAVMPRVKMRPLFWSRILLNQYCGEEGKCTYNLCIVHFVNDHEKDRVYVFLEKKTSNTNNVAGL